MDFDFEITKAVNTNNIDYFSVLKKKVIPKMLFIMKTQKKHIDNLQSQIIILNARLDILENK